MLCCKFKVGADTRVCPYRNGLRINKPYAELTPFYPSKGHISRPKTPPSAMQKVAYYYDVFHAKHLSSFIFAHKALSFSILRGERCFIYLSPDFHL